MRARLCEAPMEWFRAEKIGETESNTLRKCRACDRNLKLVRAILTSSGDIIRLFECKCGERIWEE